MKNHFLFRSFLALMMVMFVGNAWGDTTSYGFEGGTLMNWTATGHDGATASVVNTTASGKTIKNAGGSYYIEINAGTTKGANVDLVSPKSFNSISNISFKYTASDRGKTNIKVEVSSKSDFSSDVTEVLATTVMDQTIGGATIASNGTFVTASLDLAAAKSGYVRITAGQVSTSSGKFIELDDIVITHASDKEESDLEIADGKATINLSADADPAATYTLTAGVDYTTSSTGALSFETSNEHVATVSEAGVITVTGKGTATITMTQAEDDTYQEGSVEFTVNTTSTKVYIHVHTLNYEPTRLFMHAWGDEVSTIWPGIEMTDEGNGWYVASFTEAYEAYIFSDRISESGDESAELKRTDDNDYGYTFEAGDYYFTLYPQNPSDHFYAVTWGDSEPEFHTATLGWRDFTWGEDAISNQKVWIGELSTGSNVDFETSEDGWKYAEIEYIMPTYDAYFKFTQNGSIEWECAQTGKSTDLYLFGTPEGQEGNQFTITTKETKPSSDTRLKQVIYSNGFKALQDSYNVNAYYLAGTAAPEISSIVLFAEASEYELGTGSEGETTVTVTAEDGSNYLYHLYLDAVEPYSGLDATFDGSENWIKTGNAFNIDKNRGWVLARNLKETESEETDNRNQRGTNRQYYFVANAGTYSLHTATGISSNRPVKYSVNNGDWTNVTAPKYNADGAKFDIVTDGPAMIAIEANNSDGDAGFMKLTAAVTYSVTFSANGWATFAAPFNVALPADVKAHEGIIDGDALVLTEVEGVIPANEGVVLKGEAGTTAILTATTEAAAEYSESNVLVGVTAPTAAPANAYCYSKSNNDFRRVTEGLEIPANRAYFIYASSAPIRIVLGDEPFVTALENNALNVEIKKVVVNGQMMILRGGNMFDLNGRIVK